jgi:hypothetical protein
MWPFSGRKWKSGRSDRRGCACRLPGEPRCVRYTISDGFNPANPAVVATGERLASAGLPAEELALGNRQASVFVIRAEHAAG